MRTTKGWPSNSTGNWRRTREAIENILLNMKQGEAKSVVEICDALGVSRPMFRSLQWHARKNVAKQPGMDGARVYAFRDDVLYRLTEMEASERGRYDTNKGRRHVKRSLDRLHTVNTSKLDDGQTQKHRLYEAQMQTTLSALSPQRREAAERKLSNGNLDAGDLSLLFG